jgi:type IV pilus assembly protein PilA
MPSRISKVRREKGFTIVEVLIVLAIIGLILLVVFLAVPALQRNARNTQRSTDIGNILAGINEYVGNNNGRLPSGLGGSGANLVIGTGSANTIPVNLGYYSASDIQLQSLNGGSVANPVDENRVIIVTGATCDTSENGIGNAVSGSSRSVVALYTLENDSKQCRSS